MNIKLHLAQCSALHAAENIGSSAWSAGISDTDLQRDYIVQARKYLMDALDGLSDYQATLPEKIATPAPLVDV